MEKESKEKKIVIGLIGEKGSGKGTVANHLVNNFGALHFVTSSYLKKTLEQLDLPANRENFAKLAMTLKKNYGSSVLMNAVINGIEESEAKLAIADGIRMIGDDGPFREKFGKNFYLVYITADVKKRYERTRARKEKDGEDKATFEQFVKEESEATELEIGKVGKEADFKLNNDGSPEELLQQVDKMMDAILR